jgi:hypothetical protein
MKKRMFDDSWILEHPCIILEDSLLLQHAFLSFASCGIDLSIYFIQFL